MQKNFPSLDDFRKYMVTKLREVEIVRWSLYDTMIYPTAGIANLQFFQTPIGQGMSASPGNATNPKQLTDTNMIMAAQLPSPQGFWVESVELQVLPGSSGTANTFALQVPAAAVAANAAAVQAGAHDVAAIYNFGALVFTIGAKDYIREAPLVRFPPKARREAYFATASNSATAVESVKEIATAGGAPWYCDPGLALMTGINFNVALQWPVVVATPSGFNASIRCVLDGWLFRGVQ